MASQRVRQNSDSTTPNRQITRSGLTEFQDNPSALSTTGPSRIGDTTAGRIAIDDGVLGPKLQLKDGVGLQWLDPTNQIVSETFRHSYFINPAGATSRQGVLAIDDIGAGVDPLFGESGEDASFGNNVGRVVLIAVTNGKLPGNEGAVNVENQALITLTAQVNSGANQALVALKSANDGNTFTVQGVDTVLIKGFAYPEGFIDYGTDPGNIGLSSTAGTYTAIIGNATDLPVKVGHSYRISYWNDGSGGLLVNGSGFATTNSWLGKFQRSTNGGSTWADIGGTKLLGRLQVAAATRMPIPRCEVIYQPATNADVRWQFLATMSSGAATVTSQLDATHYITVEHLGNRI